MSTARAPARVSEAEYLEREAASDTKHEYVDGEMFAMAGASDRHNRIAANLLGALWGQLRGRGCFAVGSDQRHEVQATTTYTYPDAVIRCRVGAGPAVTRVVFEVLSSSTEKWDRGGKFSHLQQDPDVEEYVLVSQREHRVEHFRRLPTGQWVLTVAAGAGAVLELPGVDARVPLAEIYLGAAEEEGDEPGPFV